MALIKPINVGVAVIEHDGKVLIARRSKHVPLSGFWEFPGGKQEPNENIEDTIRREIREELNIEIKLTEKITEIECQYKVKQFLLFVYKAVFVKGEYSLKAHDDIQWVTLDQALTFDLLESNIEIVEVLLKTINKKNKSDVK